MEQGGHVGDTVGQGVFGEIVALIRNGANAFNERVLVGFTRAN